MTSTQTTFGVIGSGWRSAFFLRLARSAPDRFRATGVVTRSAERGAEVTAEWGVPGFRSVAELLAAEAPDFVIPSVPWPVTPDVTRELVALGARVLAETPPAPDLPGLRALWADVGGSGLVQVAEQYLLMPGHAARLAVVQEGIVGEPTSVQVSSTHLYHAVSMIRGLLGVGFEPVVVSARVLHRAARRPAHPRRLDRRQHAEGHRDDARHPGLRRPHGALRLHRQPVVEPAADPAHRRPRIAAASSSTTTSSGSSIPTTPVESQLVRRQTGIDLNLEGFDLDHISFDGRVVYRNPFQGARLSEDDIGVAALLEKTGAWARGEGPEPYPLAEGLQDHLISLAIEESLATGRDVTTTTEAWA